MNAQLTAINIMRKRLDDTLQSYWSDMFALKYESSWSANMQAKSIFEYGHQLITFSLTLNSIQLATANRLYKAWDDAYHKHKEMCHCRAAKVVHYSFPETTTDGMLRYFLQGTENQCNSLLLSVRVLEADEQSQRIPILKELDATIECAFDLQLITETQKQMAYTVLREYYQQDYTHKMLNFTR